MSQVWERHSEAEAFIENYLKEATEKNSELRELSLALLQKTSSRLFDWVDHLILSKDLEAKIISLGFVKNDKGLYSHPGAQLPSFILKDQKGPLLGVAVLVDSIDDYHLIHGKGGEVLGSSYAPFRSSLISTKQTVQFFVVERRVAGIAEPVYTLPETLENFLKAQDLWATRPRDLEDEEQSLRLSLAIAEEMVSLVGKPMAATILLEKERVYWQAKNTAAQVQKNRQDRLGMGWANHDHHTFRSSRAHFATLVHLFETVGFELRERFYAGKEAGWGAQIMEHPEVRLVLFLDVDLLPEEIEVDFSHEQLPETPKLGTIGLWCALHGDSILKGGMHHLEAQFMFDDLKQDLQKFGVGMMEPFSNFPYLKQAFTQGEMWPVEKRRIEKLFAEGKITSDQVERFTEKGAIGSHLENLQRRDGYKGFNQKNVSYIIQKTDPRHQD